MIQYWQSSHTKLRLMIHLVWMPKYRKRVLRGKLASRIEELLKLCAEVNGCDVLELNVQPDHVHIVVQFVPTMAVDKMVQLFKGRTNKAIREEFPELEEVCWGDGFWEDGYFAETAVNAILKQFLLT